MEISWTTPTLSRVQATPRAAPLVSSGPGAQDSVQLGGSAPAPMPTLSRVAAWLKPETTAVELKADIEALYAKIQTDDDYGSKAGQWKLLIEQAEKYLAMPDSFDGPDFGPLSRAKTNDPDVTFVCIHAPRPYLAGTMSRNWNYIQTKTAEGVHLQRIGADETTQAWDAHLWKNGAEEGMTVIGLAIGSTRDVYPVATVYTRQGEDWQPARDRFTTSTGNLEGHKLFPGGDGSLCIEEAWPEPGYLQMAFDGDTNRVLVTGGQETYSIEFADGKYSLDFEPAEEKRRKARERELDRMMDALDQPSTDGAITLDGDTVNIAGVKLPVRRIR